MTNIFAWLAGVLSDPADHQGSTQRVCLLLLTLVVCLALLVVVGLTVLAGKSADIPTQATDLIKFLTSILIGGIAWAKGVAGAVAIKGGEGAK